MSETTHAPLRDALIRREKDFTAALDRLVSLVENVDDPETKADATQALDDARHAMRECIELVSCLRRLVPTASLDAIHRAFGAPGDFGYETPIGDALARIYGVAR